MTHITHRQQFASGHNLSAPPQLNLPIQGADIPRFSTNPSRKVPFGLLGPKPALYLPGTWTDSDYTSPLLTYQDYVLS
jgi:hypothetical protein